MGHRDDLSLCTVLLCTYKYCRDRAGFLRVIFTTDMPLSTGIQPLCSVTHVMSATLMHCHFWASHAAVTAIWGGSKVHNFFSLPVRPSGLQVPSLLPS